MSNELFGASRLNTWRVELLDLDDRILGDLDLAGSSGRPGVQPGVQLDRGAFTDLKETGKATIVRRLNDGIDWTQHRLRLWYTGTGSDPMEPLATLIPTAAPEQYPSEFVKEDLELHSTLTILAEDGPGGWFGIPAGAQGVSVLGDIFNATLGPGKFLVDPSDVVLTASLTWSDDPSWLTIVNKVCSTIGFSSPRPDPWGVVRAEKYVRPEDRPLDWTFDDGPRTGLYMPDWKRDRDLLQPNRVVVVQRVEGEDTPLAVEAVLPDEHPRSAASIRRTITKTYPDVDFATLEAGQMIAERNLAGLVPTESRAFDHLWVPGVAPNSVILHKRKGVPDLRGTVVSQSIKLETGGMFHTEMRGLL